ncbi:MAG: alpha/beta hydrolase [Oscillospiraceae bacterium]|nr:alpha/beta hydrolase [Oscillospiraceae bacterium]
MSILFGGVVLKIFKNKKLTITLSSVLAALLIIVCACGAYLGDYYRADAEAIASFAAADGIEKTELSGGELVFAPDSAKAGLIFYPGGKVEYTAYEPLMRECAERGILCILVKMPFNLAVFDSNAADGIKEKFPEIKSWGIGGHSLGGSMAASYVSNKADEFDSLFLLGSYSTADLSEADIAVLSIYGSEDKVLNLEKYKKYRENLPADTDEVIIEGGCHAYFGAYGEQDGDGKAQISPAEQIKITADKIVETLLG